MNQSKRVALWLPEVTSDVTVSTMPFFSIDLSSDCSVYLKFKCINLVFIDFWCTGYNHTFNADVTQHFLFGWCSVWNCLLKNRFSFPHFWMPKLNAHNFLLRFITVAEQFNAVCVHLQVNRAAKRYARVIRIVCSESTDVALKKINGRICNVYLGEGMLCYAMLCCVCLSKWFNHIDLIVRSKYQFLRHLHKIANSASN